MKPSFKMLALLIFATTHMWAQGHAQGYTAQPLAPTQNCLIPKIDGERVPFPLRFANTKFHLVENETYLLNGTVVTMNGKFYLKVDFASQPWLATEKVLQFPYFYIKDDGSINLNLYASSGVMVQMAVVARQPDGEGVTVEGRPTMNIESIIPPAVLGIEPKSR